MFRKSFKYFSSSAQRLVIISGSSKPHGIGAHLVKRFLEQENTLVSTCDLVPFDRATISSWMQTIMENSAKNGNNNNAPEEEIDEPLYVGSTCDVTQESQVQDFFVNTKEFFDLPNVTSMVLINNAAIANPYMPLPPPPPPLGGQQENASESKFSLLPPPLAHLDTAALSHFLNVNVIGPATMMKYFGKILLSDPKNLSTRTIDAAVINISSTRSQQSEPCSEGYAASKGALESLTHASAVTNSATNAQRVRVNAIRLGWINCVSPDDRAAPQPSRKDHEFHLSGRVGEKEDVYQMCEFLADCRKSGFVNGQTLTLDGGVTKKMIYPDEEKEH